MRPQPSDPAKMAGWRRIVSESVIEMGKTHREIRTRVILRFHLDGLFGTLN